HGGGSNKQFKDHLKTIKRGDKLSPSELSVKETGKPIALWESRQQNPEQGWWPILVSTEHELAEQKFEQNAAGYHLISSALKLNEQANAWRSIVESLTPIDPMPPEITRYVTARSKILRALAAQFKFESGETIDEVNVARKAYVGLLNKQLLKE